MESQSQNTGFGINLENVHPSASKSEYDQEMLQSQFADKIMEP